MPQAAPTTVPPRRRPPRLPLRPAVPVSRPPPAYATPLVARPAHRAGYPHVLAYDVGSLDFTSPGASAVTRHVTGQIQGGSVVSLHFGYADTVAALPGLLDELDRRRLRAVTTTELLT